MSMNRNLRLLSIPPAAKPWEIGFSFTKTYQIDSSDFDKTLDQIDSDLFVQNEMFAAIMVASPTQAEYNVAVQLAGVNANGSIVTPTFAIWPGVFFPCQGIQILSAGTTAPAVIIFAGRS